MRFIDEATIHVAAGHGGPGCVSFRREKFIPRGGPNGGDGGDGGDVIFESTSNLSTLQDFRYKRAYQAQNGHHGEGTNKAGRDGEDIVILVPVGTVIKSASGDNEGEVLMDFTESGMKWVACTGGLGGKGNTHFVSSTHQAPKFAQDGLDGTKLDLKLELKLLADAAIMGYPNAGKSTLISRLSAAKPKIADYPFTTLTPNLGVVAVSETDHFVIADIPGLIEGAHRGEGLGHRFLKHLERTRVLIHLIDGTVLFEDDKDILIERYKLIRKELELYNDKLLHKPEFVVINKADAVPAAELEVARKRLRSELNALRGEPPHEGEPLVISAVSGDGVKELAALTLKLIREYSSKALGKKEILLPDNEALRK